MNGRFKDENWNLANKTTGNVETWERVQIAVLMDIRDELKIVRRQLSVLECAKFLDIPRKLDLIKRNTAKKRRPKAVSRPKLRVVR